MGYALEDGQYKLYGDLAYVQAETSLGRSCIDIWEALKYYLY
jgi:hypothetical protein